MDKVAVLTERLERYEKQLKENELWMDENFMSLPSSVQNILSRGVTNIEFDIERIKKHLKDNAKQEESK